MEKAKSWLSADDRLEPYNWRTRQRENPSDYEQRQSPAKWSAILTAVVNYQNKHHGLSPTDLMIAQDTGLSAGQVGYHIREMEKAGLIKDSKRWPRHIAVEAVAKVQELAHLPIEPIEQKEEKVEQARTVTDTSVPEQRTYTRAKRKPFMARAKQVAQAIIDHYDMYGSAPQQKWIGDRIFGENPSAKHGRVSYIVTKMVELGWLHHKPGHQHDLAVTGLGRAALFGQINETLHTDTPVSRVDPTVDYVNEQVAPPPPPPPPPPTIPRVTVPPATFTGKVVLSSPADLGMIEDVDLIIALTQRGFKVSR